MPKLLQPTRSSDLAAVCNTWRDNLAAPTFDVATVLTISEEVRVGFL